MFRLLLLVACILALSTQAGFAATLQLVPLTDHPGGQLASEFARQAAQWVMSFHNVTDGGDPVTDDTGAFQNLKQTFPVFHLGGTLGTAIERTFTARAGRPFAFLSFPHRLGNYEVGDLHRR